MVDLIFTEFLKLKRSTMFLISVIGSMVAPTMIVIATYLHQETPVKFDELFYQSNLYTMILIGIPLYGVITAYLFNREYVEDTLKNLLTIPVSRINFLMSKYLMLFLWILVLSFVAWSATLILGMIAQIEGLNLSLIIKSIKQFLLGGTLIFLLSSPLILIVLVTKNYVPPIIFSIVITLINVMSGNSEHRGLFPWAAAGDIANNTLQSTYPPEYSYLSIAVTSIIGLISFILYFKRVDIH